MTTSQSVLDIVSHLGVNDARFGDSMDRLVHGLGPADAVQQNYTGEVELSYGDSIYRFMHARLVEVTVPDRERVRINGVDVLSVYAWLGERTDVVDYAKFRVSAAMGLAYDHRFPEHGSITVFERGRWDHLLIRVP